MHRFKSFITTETLILFYYIGVLILPVGIWFLSTWLIYKYKFLIAYMHKDIEYPLQIAEG